MMAAINPTLSSVKSVDVYLCVLRSEMIVYKTYLGQSETSDSIRSLLRTGELVPIDSWAEVGFTYEKYTTEHLERSWNKIVKSRDGLQNLDKVPREGSWGILSEYKRRNV
jgi:hypothetical protein